MKGKTVFRRCLPVLLVIAMIMSIVTISAVSAGAAEPKFGDTVYEWYAGIPAIEAGQVVLHNGTLYAAKGAASSAKWTSSEWDKLGKLNKWVEFGKAQGVTIDDAGYYLYNGAIYQPAFNTADKKTSVGCPMESDSGSNPENGAWATGWWNKLSKLIYANTGKELILYYGSWASTSEVQQYEKVSQLPWDRVTIINHAFWAPKIDKNGKVTIEHIDAADLEDTKLGGKSSFSEYEKYKKQYPNVKLMLSIGGYSYSGQFSKIFSTDAGRKGFNDACVEFLKKYPFFDGIDIDWEYPGTVRSDYADYDAEGGSASAKDPQNYTAQLTDLREKLDKNFKAEGRNILTICTSTNPKVILNAGTWDKDGKQVAVSGKDPVSILTLELPKIYKVIDYANIMSYDIAGAWDATTGHGINLYLDSDKEGYKPKHSASEAVDFFLANGFKADKITIGTGLYSRGWTGVAGATAKDALGAPKSGDGSAWSGTGEGGGVSQSWYIDEFEASTGWEKGYDTKAEAAYIYNNNPKSTFFQTFLTYENERSLTAKTDYIKEKELGGLIVWMASLDKVDDTVSSPLISTAAYGLGISDSFPTLYKPEADTQTGVVVIPKPDFKFPKTIQEFDPGKGTKKGEVVYYYGGLYVTTKAQAAGKDFKADNYYALGDLIDWDLNMDIYEDFYYLYKGKIYHSLEVTSSWGGTEEQTNPADGAWCAKSFEVVADLGKLIKYENPGAVIDFANIKGTGNIPAGAIVLNDGKLYLALNNSNSGTFNKADYRMLGEVYEWGVGIEITNHFFYNYDPAAINGKTERGQSIYQAITTTDSGDGGEGAPGSNPENGNWASGGEHAYAYVGALSDALAVPLAGGATVAATDSNGNPNTAVPMSGLAVAIVAGLAAFACSKKKQ
ncbi:hypothetical protein FACS189499_03080 [Clostridia bacterium]|nr:hypothetical protein FACS189499_03080 [Clostridia bacterium]